MLLEIEDLHVHYGKAEALRGITIGIEKGQVVTLVGANGAGKTTTLRTVSGLKKPTSGEIRYNGRRIDGLDLHEIVRLGIAHVPEGRMVFATMTVQDNLGMGAYLRKNKQAIARDLENVYEHFPVLKERKGQMAGSLSGGEQQMLAMARALMASPQVMLMDEPSMGLSPLLVEEIGRIIKTINDAGTSIILVEQNARMALELAHYAYVIELGKIALQGTGKELATDPNVQKTFLGG
jgi:branched-chain amino acid transport system ATP-binding protein